MKKSIIFFITVTILTLFFTEREVNAKMDNKYWLSFLKEHFKEDGYIYDNYNNYIHSEGQGFSMLSAVYFDDKDNFDKLWNWTKNNLKIRNDNLFSWKYKDNKVVDNNNATDADIFIAWALLKAYEKWGDKKYNFYYKLISEDIYNNLIYNNGILLPGVEGFINNNIITLNLSYYVFPAIKDFSELDPKWEEVIITGENLVTLTYKKWGMIPDWINFNVNTGDILLPDNNMPIQAGHDAIRVPLYLKWAGYDELALKTSSVWLNNNIVLDPRDKSVKEKYFDYGFESIFLLSQGKNITTLPKWGYYYTDVLYILSLLSEFDSNREKYM